MPINYLPEPQQVNAAQEARVDKGLVHRTKGRWQRILEPIVYNGGDWFLVATDPDDAKLRGTINNIKYGGVKVPDDCDPKKVQGSVVADPDGREYELWLRYNG